MRAQWAVLVAMAGCHGSEDPKTPTDPTSLDGDSDTDTDADSDSDADTDSDTDADTGTIEAACAEVDGVAFADLASALAGASEGSTVYACPGTHLGPFVATVGISLVSDGDPTLTILSGQTTGTTLVVAPNTTIDGVTIRDGRGAYGGGLALSAGGPLTVTNSVVTENSATHGGGLWLPAGAWVAVLDSTVTLNRADQGGGFATDPGVTLDLTGTDILQNDAEVTGGGGFLAGSALVGGTIEGNVCNASAMYTAYSVPPLGGGLTITGDSSVLGTLILDNTAQIGGGVHIQESVVTLSDVIVSGNTADGGAAGVDVYASTVLFDGESSIDSNSSLGAGGGLYAGYADITGGHFTGNLGSQGGGVAVIFGTITGAEIDANTAQFGGGALVILGGEIHSSVIHDNVAPAGGAGVGVTAAASQPGLLVDVDLIDNQGVGLGVIVGGGVVVESSSVLRNTGGGAAVPAGPPVASLLTSTDTDWGTGADDNSGFDVSWTDADYVGYGAGATFTCEEVCDPAP